MGIIDQIKKETKTLKCGCVMQAEPVKVVERTKYHVSLMVVKHWKLIKYCQTHIPNYDKQAAKDEKRKNRGRS